mgnify:CR=1 FL=1
MDQVINPGVLDRAEQLGIEFGEGDPFRHVLIKDFVTPEFLQEILGEFPEPEPEAMRSEFGRRSRKHAVHDIAGLGGAFKRWDALLRSSEFIAFLEDLTGIQGLLHDPEYHGAGTHNNMGGQGMDVHVDFNLHRTTGYHRRLNLIVYLCEEWDPAWGGNLRLHKNPWDRPKDYFREYPPFANRAVLFETNEYSWHGFDTIRLPDDKKHLSRKSLTVYYYSKERPEEEIAPKHGTIYVHKGLPDAVTPGETLSREAFRELQGLIKRRDNFMKGMYERESNLLVRIEHLKRRVEKLEKQRASGKPHVALGQRVRNLLGRLR